MFDSYKDIFNARGESYHEAMMEMPFARREEFETTLSQLDLKSGMRLVDAPSGGGYLQDYLQGMTVDLFCVETSEAFAREAEGLRHEVVLCDRLDCIPMEPASADRVLSLAGVHHLESKPVFYKEAARLLQVGGLFCLADVLKGSPGDDFLNGFVNEYCSMGHNGVFLNDQAGEELEDCGLKVISAKEINYHWNFAGEYEMAVYCKRLFGLDKADLSAVLEGIASTVGFESSGERCRMNWSLFFIQSVRV